MNANRRSILFPNVERRNLHPYEVLLDNLSTTAYLAAPLSLYETRRYRTACSVVNQAHPNDRVLLPHAQWNDSADWLATFREVLRPVAVLYLLSDDDGFVGRGVWDEIDFLLHKDCGVRIRDAYAFSPTLTLSRHWVLQKWQGGGDWCRYAKLLIPRTNQALRQSWPLASKKCARAPMEDRRHGQA